MVSTIINFYKHSVLCRMVNWVIRVIRRFWDGSFVKRLMFTDFGLNKRFDRKDSDVVSREARGLLVGYIDGVFSNILDTSTRIFATFFFFFAIPLMAETALTLHGGGVLTFIGGLTCLGIAGVLWVLNRTPRALYTGSFMCKLFGGLFLLSSVAGEESNAASAKVESDLTIPKSAWLFYAALGLVFGGLAAFMDAMGFVIFAGGFAGFMAVMWKTEIGVFALAFLIPLVPTNIIVGISAITILSFFVKVFITRTVRYVFNLTDLFVLMYAVVLMYSFVISIYRSGGVFMTGMHLLFVFMYFAVKSTIRSKEMVFTLFALFAVSGLLVALFGIYQQLTGNFTPAAAWLDEAMFGGGGRIYSTLDNPNVLGQYLIFTILIAFALLYIYKSKLHKLAAFGVMGAAGLCILFSQSRGAWLGVIIAIGVFAFLYDRRLIILGIIALLFAPLLIPEEIIMRFMSIGDLTDSSTLFRVHIWQASMLMIRDFWISGIGLGEGAFTRIYNMYAFNAVPSPHSHNLYMQIIIDMGIAGIIAFTMVLVCAFKNMFLAVKGMGKASALPAALCAAMVGYMIQGLTDNTFYNYRIVAFFWFCIALCAAMKQSLKTGESKTDDGGRV